MRMLYEDMLQPETVLATVNTLTHTEHSKVVFASYIFTCTPRFKTTEVPRYVSIITRKAPIATTLLPVEQSIKPTEKQLGVGICVKVSYGDIEPVKIVEWMELHRSWKVAGVMIYNNSLSPKTLDVLQYYINMGFVELRQAPNYLYCVKLKIQSMSLFEFILLYKNQSLLNI